MEMPPGKRGQPVWKCYFEWTVGEQVQMKIIDVPTATNTSLPHGTHFRDSTFGRSTMTNLEMLLCERPSACTEAWMATSPEPLEKSLGEPGCSHGHTVQEQGRLQSLAVLSASLFSSLHLSP